LHIFLAILYICNITKADLPTLGCFCDDKVSQFVNCFKLTSETNQDILLTGLHAARREVEVGREHYLLRLPHRQTISFQFRGINTNLYLTLLPTDQVYLCNTRDT